MSAAPDVTPSPTDDRTWRDALERVIAGEGLRVVAQPIVDVAGGRVAGYELLSRFDGPPATSPDVWFRAAREHGLHAELTARAVRLQREVAEGRPPGTFCTMNVEPDLLGAPPVVEALLGSGRLDEVVVELTEHVDHSEDPGLAEAMAAVRALGGSIAMDDAGTGYSGLTQMLTVRPDVVKVDRSLVQGLDDDPVRRAAVRLLGDLAGEMDAWLLAEGVETAGELAELVRLGVPLVQGWAVGRPGPGWPGVPAPALEVLTGHRVRTGLGDHVLALVRPVVPRQRGLRPDDSEGQVLLDGRGRPAAVVVVDPTGGRHAAPALVVAPSTPPVEVLRRAMARDTAVRHAAVVCTDTRGAVVGTVAVSALVDHVLAGHVPPG